MYVIHQIHKTAASIYVKVVHMLLFRKLLQVATGLTQRRLANISLI